MKNIKNYSVKFYHIFVVFLFVSLSFQTGFAQIVFDAGTIKLYFDKVDKTKTEMDIILAGDSTIYLQVYAEYSSEFTAEQVSAMNFTSATFSWVFCDESGNFIATASPDVQMLAHPRMNCPNGDLGVSDYGSASYAFAEHGCPTYGYYAMVTNGGKFGEKLKDGSTHIVKMGSIGFKLTSTNGFFVRMEPGKAIPTPIDKSFGEVIYNHTAGFDGTVEWQSGFGDWGGTDRLIVDQVGGVVVKKGFKNKSV